MTGSGAARAAVRRADRVRSRRETGRVSVWKGDGRVACRRSHQPGRMADRIGVRKVASRVRVREGAGQASHRGAIRMGG